MKILILGAGDVGFHLTKKLSGEGHDLTLVERDPEKLRRAEEQLDALIVSGSASSPATLRKAGLDSADVLAALTSSDEVNLLACQIARLAGVPRKIARMRSLEFLEPGFEHPVEALGPDLIIHPEREAADAVVRLIRQSQATDVLEFADGAIQLLGIRLETDAPVLGRPLMEAWQLLEGTPTRIVAVARKQKTIIPGGKDYLFAGDQIFILSLREAASEVIRRLGKDVVNIRNVMILGGGLVGQLAARALQKEMSVKLIESRSDRSDGLAEILPDTLVIHGDGIDMDLLAVEGITDMDAFVAVTGDDETNIIATLVARHLQVPRTIALVNRTEYLPITPTIGLDAVVSKKLLTVDAILRFLRTSNVQNLASIPGVDAIIIELEARAGSRITRAPIRKLDLPRDAALGAVHRGGEDFIATGETVIEPGDRVVAFCLPRAINRVETLFA